MRFRETLRSSFRALGHNRLRSLLTMLGVIIGVFSVVMLTSIGEGVKRQVTSQVESLGANLLYVMPGRMETRLTKGSQPRLGAGSVPRGGMQGGLGVSAGTLTYDDVLALKGAKPIDAATAIASGTNRLDALDILVTTTGVDEDFFRIRNPALRFGRYITRAEREEKAAVAVIGYEANKELFGGKNSVGKTFRLNGKPHRVVGVLVHKKPGNFGFSEGDINIAIYLPITEMTSLSTAQTISQIMVRAISAAAVKSAGETITRVLRRRHHGMDFSVLKQEDMLSTINSIISILTAALGGIAAISLVVGGIGIMNIMLVSVTERTREIGARKAIGAKRRDILIQFLIEAVVLSFLGGILGLVLGMGGARVLPLVIPDIHTAVSPLAVAVSLLFAFAVGGFFGVYPAVNAAGLDPIEALRRE